MRNHAPKAQVVQRQHVAQKTRAIRNRPLKRGVIGLLLAVVLSLIYVWARIQVIQLGYEISKLRLHVNELNQEKTQLETDIALLTAPDRLEQVAEQVFQMRRPTGAEIIYVPFIETKKQNEEAKELGLHAQVSDRR